MSKLTQVVTGVCRASYVHLNEPRPEKDGSPGKYEVSVMVPKEDKATMKKINAAIEAAKQEGKAGKWGGKMPRVNSLKLPIRDGDEDSDDEAYEGHYYFTARAKNRPVVMDRKRNLIDDDEEIYSGMYAAFILNFYPFDVESKGIAVGLEAVMKIKDGERLGGGRMSVDAVSEAFEGFDFPDDDEDEDDGAGGFF